MIGPISVVVAAYNGSQYITEQLSTILADLRSQDEVWIVDDASTDETVQTISDFHDPRVRVVVNDRNIGVRKSFEKVLGMVRHEIVFLSDQDDRWLPGKRAALTACFEADPRCLVALSDAEIIDAASVLTAPSFMDLRGGFKPGLLATLIKSRYLGCAMAMRRSFLQTALPIPDGAPMHDMWFGALATVMGTVHYIPEAFIQYRRHGGNVTSGKRQPALKMLRWRLGLFLAVMCRALPVLGKQLMLGRLRQRHSDA